MFDASPSQATLVSGQPETGRILIVVHRPESNTGAVGQWLKANGFGVDIRCPAVGDPLPPTLEDHAGAIVFGGPMSANDNDEFIRREIDWIGVPLNENKPFFGICLGAQMLAKHIGGTVGEHPDALIEVGYYPVRSDDGSISPADWPSHVYQWHREGFTLPSDARRLMTGTTFENQAFQYGEKAFGVQFHPEMTLAMIHRWTTRAAHRLSGPGALPRSQHIASHAIHGPGLRVWLDRFMRRWIGEAA